MSSDNDTCTCVQIERIPCKGQHRTKNNEFTGICIVKVEHSVAPYHESPIQRPYPRLYPFCSGLIEAGFSCTCRCNFFFFCINEIVISWLPSQGEHVRIFNWKKKNLLSTESMLFLSLPSKLRKDDFVGFFLASQKIPSHPPAFVAPPNPGCFVFNAGADKRVIRKNHILVQSDDFHAQPQQQGTNAILTPDGQPTGLAHHPSFSFSPKNPAFPPCPSINTPKDSPEPVRPIRVVAGSQTPIG